MKKFLKPVFIVSSLILGMATFTSCGEDTGIGTLPGGEDNPEAPTLKVTYNNQGSPDRNITVLAKPGGTANVNVHFEDNNPEKGNMYRLYITKNEYGVDDSFVPFKYTTAKIINPDGTEQTIKVDLKRDGSIDLGKIDKKSFTFNMNLPAASDANGTIQYVFWATKARGDFRDISNDNALPNKDYGTIAVKSSENANAQAKSYREFSALLLAAPSAEGVSPSFISVFDGNTYKIAQQQKNVTGGETFSDSEKTENAEYASLWDFGYFYTGSGSSGKANFASANEYMNAFRVGGKPVLDITKITGLTKTELNAFYFAKSSMNFDNITKGSDLESITSSGVQKIRDVNVGDVIEFVDAYGNKGLIKITDLKRGYGYNPAKSPEENDHIKFDVKLQVNSLPIKG